MNFKDQYLHPMWQKKRLEVLVRDDWTCQKCRRQDITLHVHHRYYLNNKKIWEYPMDAYETLCEDCHPQGNPNQIPNVNKYELQTFRQISEEITSQPFTMEMSLFLDALIDAHGI